MTRDDAHLLSATAAGDADAYAEFFRRHEASVTRYALRRCSTPDHVADAVAETFLVALRAAGRYRPEKADALPWLLGIAQRVMGHQARGDRRRVRLGLRARAASPLYEAEEYERVAEALDAQRRLAGLAQALEKLPRRERAVLDLVALADLTPTQAARALGISPNAARVRLSRARQRLREAEAALDPEVTCA